MRSYIYIEGGASKDDKIRCRQGFRKLLEKADFEKRMPRLSACGSRNAAFDDFKTAQANGKPGDYIALLVDSEDPVDDIESPWQHLKKRDNWDTPSKAVDEQVLFMTTCMETWIVADRPTLKAHYGSQLQESALPPEHHLESRSRHDIQEKLLHATRNCSNAYAKGKRSFEVLEKINPEALASLPSFERLKRILNEKLSEE